MSVARTITLIPWYQFLNSLLFWQAVWFLYFQANLSGAEAILLYAVYDVATTVLEVPSGYFSDRIGRKLTLLLAAGCSAAGCLALAVGGGFTVFAVGQCLIGAGAAFKSGTDSALLYEALDTTGRTDEVEQQEVRAWRFSLAGFGMSSIIGGGMAMASLSLPFYATSVAFALAGVLVALMAEPAPKLARAVTLRDQFSALRLAFLNPVLGWLFVLSVLMYGFSHLPFVFGQPFILTALEARGLATEAPFVSGVITSVMMIVSALATLVAVQLRRSLGLVVLLLAAFGLQVALAGALAASTSTLVIGVLLLRMVPDSLAYPFILARVQPLLHDNTRATYLSLKSLGGKVFFAATLFFAAQSTTETALLPAADLQRILGWYTLAGLCCLAALAFAARWIAIASPQKTE
jgi:MFS family permease